MRSMLLWTLLLSVVGCGLSARILAVVPFPGKSHYIFISSILKTLVQRGHEVVEYSPFVPSKPMPNHTHVEVHTAFEEMIKTMSFKQFSELTKTDDIKWGFGIRGMWGMLYGVCEQVFEHENIQKLLKSNEHFDLVITESTFGQESMVVFGHKFGAPTVTLQGFPSWSVLNRAAGNALSIAYIPDFTSFVTTDQMTLIERIFNFLSTVTTLTYYYNVHLPIHEKIIKQNYKEDFPPLVDIVSNVSLYLINSHPAIEYTRPHTPNIIPIAGINISPERPPLPKDIQKFMDEAKEGVLYFSLGTVVPAHLLPQEKLEAFVNAFKKVSQKVLWKIEIDSLPGLSNNVMLTKWVPQPEVLAHPNCALFITHGGLFSQQEANYAGVPTVGIPFFGDQPYNVKFSEHRGVGVKLDYSTLSEETILAAVNTVLRNPKYKENAVRTSAIFRDQPLSSRDSAVFWVEYVLRHHGAAHLRSAAAQLSWYQLALLDVLAVLVTALLAVCVIIYLVLRKLYSSVFGGSKSTKVAKGKKKN